MNGKSTTRTTICMLCVAAPLAVAVAPVPESPEPAPACQLCPCIICIGPGKGMMIDASVMADCIHVETGGTLTITGSGRLTLIAPGTSCVHGDVFLKPGDERQSPVLAFARGDHTITCSGNIIGLGNYAQIHIASGVTLTSDVKIAGQLQISGGGNFVNARCVTANALRGVLDLEVTGTIEDTVGACWRVIGPGAWLRFVTEPKCLDGDFLVSDGTLRAGTDVSSDDIDVVTTGDLSHTGGKIVAGVDDSFTFNAPRCPE